MYKPAVRHRQKKCHDKGQVSEEKDSHRRTLSLREQKQAGDADEQKQQDK
jgi:hypothetical protein